MVVVEFVGAVVVVGVVVEGNAMGSLWCLF